MIKLNIASSHIQRRAYTFQSTLIIPAYDIIKHFFSQTVDSESGRPIKFNHHNSVRHCSGMAENSPTRGACLSAGLLWCLLTQEAYPEASSTPQLPSWKRPSPPEECSTLPCCPDPVSERRQGRRQPGLPGNQ